MSKFKEALWCAVLIIWGGAGGALVLAGLSISSTSNDIGALTFQIRPAVDSIVIVTAAAEKSLPVTLQNVKRLSGDSSFVVRRAIKEEPPWYLRWLGFKHAKHNNDADKKSPKQ